MKKLTVKKGAACMACLDCVRTCSESFYKEFDPGKAAIKVIERKGEPKPTPCPQCGKCAKACEVGAITQNAKGVYMVNKKVCTGCGACVEACPFGIMVKAESSPVASKCIACGLCARNCPVEILEVVETA
ncbi:MAG: 4Fe-4S dicluster domain-containing protein [Lachnospiraceae bacterium]